MNESKILLDRIFAAISIVFALGGVWSIAENATLTTRIFMTAVVVVTLFRVVLL